MNRTKAIAARILLITGILAIPLLIVLYHLPLATGLTRSLTLFSIASAWGLLLLLSTNHRAFLLVSLLPPLLFAALLVLPASPANADHVRAEYVRALLEFEGVPYFWGGESKGGIDCSGLIRQGYIRALCRIALSTRNPGLFREALDLWWHDATAKQMLLEYRGKTIRGSMHPSINAIPASELRPGDFAVTENGVHVLAYLGDDRWIEADPGPMKVLLVQVPEKMITWFHQPVVVVRWKSLL